jgi:hypothetical protein
VEVVDPTHPLFGRQFPLAHTSTTLTGPGYAWVVYRDFMQLRIPLAATNLVPARPQVRTTFTEQAIADLLALAGAWELWEAGMDVCRLPRTTSGDGCPPSSANRSATR